MENRNIIPVFYSCDNNYIKYGIVSIQSLIDNSSDENQYNIYILCAGLEDKYVDILKSMEKDNVSISIDDISRKAEEFVKNLPVRDYYSCMTYYRLLIPDSYPQYDKAVYIDSDTIVQDDIAKLYNIDIGNSFLGAAYDGLVNSVELYGEYAEQVLDIDRTRYFNAGVIVINLQQFREHKVIESFMELARTYTFVVAQDQDYLNVICKDKVYYMDYAWNFGIMTSQEMNPEDIHIIHYHLAAKPWHYDDCRLGDYFWKYARKTPVYDEIMEVYENFSDEEKELDEEHSKHLYNLAVQEIERQDNYRKLMENMQITNTGRHAIVEKIAALEKEGRFDEDVEDDPPGKQLLPDDIDYEKNPWKKRLRTRFAFKIARWFVNYLLKEKSLVIKDIVGIENFRNLETGAIITCNHFNAYDSFAMDLTFDQSLMRAKGKKMYRIIKEANYTSFPGFYGFLMRNCNTLPLSSNKDTMRKLLKAVDNILSSGDFILVYPEQSMWWNYRKPKPLKKGAFKFAAKSNVPVLPVFITMEDTDVKEDGEFFVQAYTIHVGKPIYPDKDKPVVENADEMLEKNYLWWKEVYEDFYKIPLTYTCGEVNCFGVVVDGAKQPVAR